MKRVSTNDTRVSSTWEERPQYVKNEPIQYFNTWKGEYVTINN